MAKSQFVFEATDANFAADVLEKSHQVPVVVDFWAPWCGPCRTLAPILERLVDAKAGEVVLAKVNVDENPVLAEQFRIEGIPAVMAIRNGRLVDQFSGALPEAMIEEFLNRLVPSAGDRAVTQAAELEQSKPNEATKIYSDVLEKEPKNIAALLGLARMRLAAGDASGAMTLLDKVSPGGDDGAEADRIRAIIELASLKGDDHELQRRLKADPENANLWFESGKTLAGSGRYAEALAALYAAAERDRPLARGAVKDLMVKIFQVIGQRSEMAEEYRDKLRRVMY
jgi:putative thioredoxin